MTGRLRKLRNEDLNSLCLSLGITNIRLLRMRREERVAQVGIRVNRTKFYGKARRKNTK